MARYLCSHPNGISSLWSGHYFGGVTELLISDNLKSAVTRAGNYDPDVNPDYTAIARHYGSASEPLNGESYRAHVESSVKLVQRWILARLRHFIFYSIAELNKEIERLASLYHDKVMKHLGKSRRELFVKLDKPALIPLLATKYEYKD